MPPPPHGPVKIDLSPTTLKALADLLTRSTQAAAQRTAETVMRGGGNRADALQAAKLTAKTVLDQAARANKEMLPQARAAYTREQAAAAGSPWNMKSLELAAKWALSTAAQDSKSQLRHEQARYQTAGIDAQTREILSKVALGSAVANANIARLEATARAKGAFHTDETRQLQAMRSSRYAAVNAQRAFRQGVVTDRIAPIEQRIDELRLRRTEATAAYQARTRLIQERTALATSPARSTLERIAAESQAAVQPIQLQTELARAKREAADAPRRAKDELRREQTGFNAAQHDTYRQASTLFNLGLHRQSMAMNRAAGFGQGLADLGFTRAGAMVTRAAPVAAAGASVLQGLEKTGEGYAILQDPYATGTQKTRRMIQELVPGGERAMRLYDQFTGRAAAMEKADVEARKMGIMAQTEAQVSGTQYSERMRFAAVSGSAEAMRAVGPALPPVTNRGTSAGEQEYRDLMRTLPLRQQLVQAERQLRSSTTERVAAEKELTRISERENFLVARRKELEKDVSQKGSGAERIAALGQIAAVDDQIRAVHEQKQTAIRGVAEQKQNEARAAAEAEKARIREQLLSQAEVMEGRAERMGGRARHLGSMTEAERAIAFEYAKMAKQNGLASLPPEMRAQAVGFLGEEGQFMLEEYGQQTPEFQAAQQLGWKRDFGAAGETTGGLRTEAAKKRAEAEQQSYQADVRAGESMVSAVKDLEQVLVSSLRELGEHLKHEVDRMKQQERSHW